MVSNSTLSGNSATDDGGGVYNSGELKLSNSSLSGNTATNNGGGIFNFFDITVSNCSVTGNTAASGGGIYTFGGTLTLVGSNDISNNSPDNIVHA
jgi:predicted outer membrane repeat protein